MYIQLALWLGNEFFFFFIIINRFDEKIFYINLSDISFGDKTMMKNKTSKREANSLCSAATSQRLPLIISTARARTRERESHLLFRREARKSRARTWQIRDAREEERES